jgi:hypothetical protein
VQECDECKSGHDWFGKCDKFCLSIHSSGSPVIFGALVTLMGSS